MEILGEEVDSSISDLPTMTPSTSPTFLEVDIGELGLETVGPTAAPIEAPQDPIARRRRLDVAVPVNPALSEAPTKAPTGKPTFIDLVETTSPAPAAELPSDSVTELAAPLNPVLTEAPTKAPTGKPTFIDLVETTSPAPAAELPTETELVAPVNPALSEAPTKAPTGKPTFIDLVETTSPAPASELPTETELVAPLNPALSEAPTKVPTTAPTFIDLETDTASETFGTPNESDSDAVNTTTFEAYLGQLEAVWRADSGCFEALTYRVAQISSCSQLHTAIVFDTPCVIDSLSDVDAFEGQANTVCSFVGSSYFAKMNANGWVPWTLDASIEDGQGATSTGGVMGSS